LAGGLIDVTVAAANGTVEGCEVAGHRTVLPMCGDVVAGSEMREFNPDPAYLHPEHALVEVGAPVRTAYRILVPKATVFTFAA
jgi:hypothetical protein